MIARRASMLRLTLALSVACLALPIAAHAATITYQSNFSTSTDDAFPQDQLPPDGVGNSERVDHFLSDLPGVGFVVPAFDSPLGTLTFLHLEINGILTLRGSVQFGEIFGVVTLNDPFDPGSLLGEVQVNRTCTSGCIFNETALITWEFNTPDGGGIDFNLADSHDRFVTWEVAAKGRIITQFRGTTRAVYTYDPFPSTTPVPEPASLLLLGSGLIAGGLHRRRRGGR